MAWTRTRVQRANYWRNLRNLAFASVAITALQAASALSVEAQTKAPSRNQITKAANQAPQPDVQAFAIVPDGNVAEQLIRLNIDPADAEKAAEAVNQAIAKNEVKTTASSGRAVLENQGRDKPKRLATLQIYSNRSLAIDLHRNADGSYGFKLAPGATESDDERVSSLPSVATTNSAAARTLLPTTVTSIKATGATLAASLSPAGTNPASVAEFTRAVATTGDSTKIEVVHGRTADGTPRLLYASIGDIKNQRSVWWYAPPNQPEGWFDENGRRLGGTALSDPKPGSRVSSPFGTRRYYGRASGGGFHNGIDFEGKTGEPILAAADGVINHQGWYFNYGRTVKISHADNFETLYAHMSRFADGIGPGTHVRKGDVIGYIGSTGRSTGPHLHFSAIVNGQFVDPQPYISDNGGHSTLGGESLVSFRQWQQEVRGAQAKRSRSGGDGDAGRGLQGGDPWSTNPFIGHKSFDRQ